MARIKIEYASSPSSKLPATPPPAQTREELLSKSKKTKRDKSKKKRLKLRARKRADQYAKSTRGKTSQPLSPSAVSDKRTATIKSEITSNVHDIEDTNYVQDVTNVVEATAADVQASETEPTITKGPMTPLVKEPVDENLTAILKAEERATAAELLIEKGHQTRLRHIRDGHWTLISRELIRICKDTKALTNQQDIGLIFQRVAPFIDQGGRPRWYFTAGMVISETAIRTEPMEIPKYPSSEPITVFAEAEGGAIFETEFVFLGVGCLGVRIPQYVVKRALGIRGGTKNKDKQIEFVGVQVREHADDEA